MQRGFVVFILVRLTHRVNIKGCPVSIAWLEGKFRNNFLRQEIKTTHDIYDISKFMLIFPKHINLIIIIIIIHVTYKLFREYFWQNINSKNLVFIVFFFFLSAFL